MESWELIARELVRATVMRYVHLVDTGKLDELVELFAEDATLEAGDLPPATGRAAIRALFVETTTRLAAATARPLIRHHVSSLEVDVLGPASASARSYFLAVTERGPDHWGRYRDRLVQADGRWLFQHRRVRTDGRAADSAFG
jgi:ketosteroid isomerase-like protein